MTRLVRAELLKVASTRSAWWLLAGACFLGLVQVAFRTMAGIAEPPSPRGLVSFGGAALVFAGLLGVVVATDDERLGTTTHALLAAPRRLRLLSAKATATFVASAAMSLVVTLVAVPAGLFFLRLARGGAYEFDVTVSRQIAAQVIGIGLMGLLGLATGIVLRSQAVAAVLVALWFSLGETSFLVLVGNTRWRFGPVGAFQSVIRGDGYRGWAMLVLAAYVALLGGFSARRFLQREFS